MRQIDDESQTDNEHSRNNRHIYFVTCSAMKSNNEKPNIAYWRFVDSSYLMDCQVNVTISSDYSSFTLKFLLLASFQCYIVRSQLCCKSNRAYWRFVDSSYLMDCQVNVKISSDYSSFSLEFLLLASFECYIVRSQLCCKPNRAYWRFVDSPYLMDGQVNVTISSDYSSFSLKFLLLS